MSAKNLPVAIVLAAGRGTRLQASAVGLPKALVTVAGTPAIVWILVSLLRSGVRRFVIVESPIGRRLLEDILARCFTGLDAELVHTVQVVPKGPGDAIATGLLATHNAGWKDSSILVALCDTLFTEDIPFESDWLGISAPADGGDRWCWVESSNGKVMRFFDKVTPPSWVKDVLIGLYYFADRSGLESSISVSEKRSHINNEIQISSILEPYIANRDVAAHPVKTWVDCGDEVSLQHANEAMYRTRASNHLEFVRDVRGTFIKKRGNTDDISCQVGWFRSTESRIKDLIPDVQLVSADCYESDYFEMDLLAEHYLFRPGGDELVGSFILSLLTILSERLWNAPTSPDFNLSAACEQMYQQKLLDRLASFPLWMKLDARGSVEVAGFGVVAPRQIVEDCMSAAMSPGRGGWIHGDLHLGNILVNPLDRSLRLIDPRGSFGMCRGPSGDVYYDLAKLRHSLSGMYDAIICGLYQVTLNHDLASMTLRLGPVRSVAVDMFDQAIERIGFDLRRVKLIEIGLFLSMLPIHRDDPERQKAILVRAFQQWFSL